MRYILREYLSGLKEDRELDVFVTELLHSMRIIPLSKTQRGRQDGVDISAVGTDIDGERKVFLFVIKQGNFSRISWNGGKVNDIMPSLDEARIVYLQSRIPEPFKNLKKKLVVCSNGYLEQTVDQFWALYVNQHTSAKLEYEYWGVDHLVDLALTYQLNETILSPELATRFRRALAFIDLSDYDLSHFYSFLNSLLPQHEVEKPTIKNAIKKIRLINLCLSITHLWCADAGNLKPCYIAGERILLNCWGWLERNKLFEDKAILTEYYKIIHNWSDLANQYVLKVRSQFQKQVGLGRGISDHNEYCLVTFEQIGIISAIGLYHLWDCRYGAYSNTESIISQTEQSFVIADSIADSLCLLINNNPSVNSPRYDENCIEIVLALILLCETGKYQHAISWLQSIISFLNLNFQIANFFPLFITNVEKLAEAKAEDQKSSMLLNILAEWCLILKLNDFYELLRDLVTRNFKHVDLQLWMPEKNIDERLFISDATQESGAVLTGIILPANIKEFEMTMAEERILFCDEYQSSTYKYGIDFLPFIASRHFRTYPFPNQWRKLLSTNFCFNKKSDNES